MNHKSMCQFVLRASAKENTQYKYFLTIIHVVPNNMPEYGNVLSTQKSIVYVDYGVVVGIK